MAAQVLGELLDPPREEGDLYLRRPRVGGVRTVLLDDFQLGFLGEAHAAPLVDDSAIPAPREGRSTQEPRLRSRGRLAAGVGAASRRLQRPYRAREASSR